MPREVGRAEAWERAHEMFTQVNFNAFDFNTIKQSLLDYMKLYYPEDFNDYIESSEFVAILELFAYVGELLAYRIDLNAHENFLTTAQRKESILRLAKLISYKATRNIPARGFVKVNSIQTTENVIDSSGRNLANRRIVWNDINNINWKEQFFLVINRILEQEFGTVRPSERVQIDDVLFELYTLSNSPLSTSGASVYSYNTSVNGVNYPMELVPVILTENGPEERRPENNLPFSLVYANDGLGDGSNTTGFMMFTKQGTLDRLEIDFDGATPNQTFDLTVSNINDTDVWINNVDPQTREVLTVDPADPLNTSYTSEGLRYGEWVEVDLANSQNVFFNTSKNRHKYEIETLNNDQIRLIFGDGEFADVPAGRFHVWFRTSANDGVAIPRSVVVNQTATFIYNDDIGNVQTMTMTFSLIGSLMNSSTSETLAHIRRVAPGVYYTQDRMVNGKDYNTYLLQDPSIVRLRALNRTFAGDSKYITWHDPREAYENVKMFGDDLALYWVDHPPQEGHSTRFDTLMSVDQIRTYIEQTILSSIDFFAWMGVRYEEAGQDVSSIRRTFVYDDYSFTTTGPSNEIDALTQATALATQTTPSFDVYYSFKYDEWTIGPHPCDQELSPFPHEIPTTQGCNLGKADSTHMITVEALYESGRHIGWRFMWRSVRMIAQSQATKFYNTNRNTKVISYDSFVPRMDTITVLQANTSCLCTGLLTENVNCSVLGQVVDEQHTPNTGLIDTHRLIVLPEDINSDGIADNLSLNTLFEEKIEKTYQQFVDQNIITTDPSNILPRFEYETLTRRKYGNDISYGWDKDFSILVKRTQLNGSIQQFFLTFADGDLIAPASQQTALSSYFHISSAGTHRYVPQPANDTLTLIVRGYAYFQRDDESAPWVPVRYTEKIHLAYLVESKTIAENLRRYQRYVGRYPLNFGWFHIVPSYHLVDPAASNIIDIFIITRGYYTELRRWLDGRTTLQPAEPTPIDLRTSYASLLENKMISDTVILHPGRFKILFGPKAPAALGARFKIIRPEQTVLTDNEVKVRVVQLTRTFFNLDYWEFGETFYFTELAAMIHSSLGPEISSIVIVPSHNENQFGDLFQVVAREDEVFIPDISTSDIDIVESYTVENLRLNG